MTVSIVPTNMATSACSGALPGKGRGARPRVRDPSSTRMHIANHTHAAHAIDVADSVSTLMLGGCSIAFASAPG